MSELTINIARDYSPYPVGRYRTLSDTSGEEFRERLLVPNLQKGIRLTVELDGTEGYPSSFLEEAFGGLVRAGFSLADLKKKLVLKARSPSYEVYKMQAWGHMEKQAQESDLAATSH